MPGVRVGRLNFDARRLNAIGEEAAMRSLIATGFRLARDIKLSFGDSGIARATKSERESNRSAPGETPHVQTGRLRGSISVNWEASGKTRGDVNAPARGEDGVSAPSRAFTVWVGTNVEYAVYLEFGTRRMAPRPFMRPALDRLRLAI